MNMKACATNVDLKYSFLQNLRGSGLLDDRSLAHMQSLAPPDAPLEDLACALVHHGLLTEYQVKALMDGTSRLVLGQYHILEELGQGGFGCVFKARHTLMDRIVALKVISPEWVEDPVARDRFRREVLAATRLNHPNIAMAYDANEVDGLLFFVLEYVDGMDLHRMVRKHGPLSVSVAAEVLRQTARALQYAHEQGMVHRDIKPANLLITRTLPPTPSSPDLGMWNATIQVKVVDFGLAQLHGLKGFQGYTLAREGMFLGTPEYVSPEQARDSHAVDIRSDLYSLGCTCFFALTGRGPFVGKTPMELVVQHLEKEAPAIESLRPEVPPTLASIIRRLLAKDPSKRFQAPTELLAELALLVGSLGSSPLISVPPAQAIPPRPSDEASLLKPTVETARDLDVLPLTTALPLTAPNERPASQGHAEGSPTRSFAASLEVQQQQTAEASPAVHPPAVSSPPPDSGALRELWKAWLVVLETLARGKGIRICEAEYRKLHTCLLQELRTHAQTQQGATRQQFARLEATVQPWLSAATLAQAGMDTLRSLREKCLELEASLDLRQSSSPVWTLFVAALGFAAAIGAGLWFFGR